MRTADSYYFFIFQTIFFFFYKIFTIYFKFCLRMIYVITKVLSFFFIKTSYLKLNVWQLTVKFFCLTARRNLKFDFIITIFVVRIDTAFSLSIELTVDF